MIYTDSCLQLVSDKIHSELNETIVRRINSTSIGGENSKWSINEAMALITIPQITLAVINKLDEMSIMEIALLSFMCKPILVTDKAIKEFSIVSETVDFIDDSCNLMTEPNNFISWYRRQHGPSYSRR
jgi:hypothetical protein